MPLALDVAAAVVALEVDEDCELPLPVEPTPLEAPPLPLELVPPGELPQATRPATSANERHRAIRALFMKKAPFQVRDIG